MKACRSIVGKDEYEQELLDAIRDCKQIHQRIELFTTDDDDVHRVEGAILELFSGTGYRYTGDGIVYDENWLDDEE